jgi:hypothetical protein
VEFAVMRHPTAKIVLLAVCFLPGCRVSSAPETPVAAATLAEGEHVTLVQQAGPLAVIEYRDGKQGYVPLGLLKHRNTAVNSNGETFTHICRTGIARLQRNAVRGTCASRTAGSSRD